MTNGPSASLPDPQRRLMLKGMAGLPLVSAVAAGNGASVQASVSTASGGLQGARQHFDLATTYLNGAFMHPISHQARQCITQYLNARVMNQQARLVSMAADREQAIALFCQLFSVDADELAWVPSTTVAENLVVSGLGLHQQGSVVTDTYHFNGSLFMYNEFARQGLQVHIVRDRNNRIDLADLEQAIRPDTRLLALTLVSSVAGFQHDLKAVCDMAHRRGVMVYADIIQAAGTMPLDLHASNVDFAACSTYKWLMGDFGIGIMYARRDSQEALQRSQIGYRQEAHMQTHYLPFDTPAAALLETQALDGLAGRVGVGTLSASGVAALTYSLDYLLTLGLKNIEAWRQPLLAQLREALPALGYPCMTPPESRSAIISFACEQADKKLAPALTRAGVEVTLYPNYLRISPSIYNQSDDVDRLLDALQQA